MPSRFKSYTAHYLVEGTKFACLQSIVNFLQTLGYPKLSRDVVRNRIKKGASTFAQLGAAASTRCQHATTAHHEKLRRERAECAAMCAEIDARKAAMRGAA